MLDTCFCMAPQFEVEPVLLSNLLLAPNLMSKYLEALTEKIIMAMAIAR